MTSKKISQVVFILLLITFGCDDKKAERKEEVKVKEEVHEVVQSETAEDTIRSAPIKPEVTFTPGSIQTVKALGDSQVVYSLYLPKTYNTLKKYPVVYLFDPKGNGQLPVEKYQSLAERYELVLVGSYNSKNGLAWDKIQPQIQKMMNDCKARLAIDKKRMYTSGFSGGARVASGMAISGDEIRGVIACGGGFPGKSTNIGYPFDFYGIVGEEDFNLNELRQLDWSMNNSGMTHYIKEVKGGHDWPALKEMEAAYLWHLMSAMKKNLIPKNTSLIDSLAKAGMNEVLQKKKKNEPYEALLACKKWISVLKELTSVDSFKSEGNALYNTESVKARLSEITIIQEKEGELTRKYWAAFEKEDLDWWKNTYATIQASAKKSTLSPEERNMHKRIQGFLGLAAFTVANAAIQQSDFDKALKLLKIYELIEPKNSEHAYLHAKVYAATGNWNLAHTSLKRAIQLGFTDTIRVEEEKLFFNAPDKKEYKELLAKIKHK